MLAILTPRALLNSIHLVHSPITAMMTVAGEQVTWRAAGVKRQTELGSHGA